VVEEAVVDFLVEGHLQDKMKQKVIYLDVSLLIVVLVDFQSEFILTQWHLYFFPHFELRVQLEEDAKQQVCVTQTEGVLEMGRIAVVLDRNVEQLQSGPSFEVSDAQDESILSSYV